LEGKFIVDKGILWKGRDLIPRLLGGGGETDFGLTDEAVENILDGLDVGALSGVLVGKETESGVGFAGKLDAKVDELEHDRFQDTDRSVLESLPIGIGINSVHIFALLKR